MNFTLRIVLLFAIVAYFILLLCLIRKKMLNLKYSLLWFFSGIVMFLGIIFPNIVEFATILLGIKSLTSGLFALLIFFILIILISITSIVSKIKDENKRLIQECSLIEKRVRELEKAD